jgi:hypothetical protein
MLTGAAARRGVRRPAMLTGAAARRGVRRAAMLTGAAARLAGEASGGQPC